MILTSKQHAKHPFAGRNSQQIGKLPGLSEIHLGLLSLFYLLTELFMGKMPIKNQYFRVNLNPVK